ncbi:copper resistance protein B [Luteimonas marina]|uniref:Copper resistance protein B n=1 Tax=Luteimonas marina TaxID=488485 RepID=A0A5C5U8A6_9GAMM|nr:copper resistance protein B [Luteimonas marina]TWT22601.1 copper resistance protein B [Luteimonas marina]
MRIPPRLPLLSCAIALALAMPARAQHAGHARHASSPACTAEHAAMGHCTPEATPPDDGCPPGHAAMGHCTPARGEQAPREPIPPLTDEDRAAAFPVLSHAGMAHGPAIYGRVKLDRLEAWDGRHARGQSWEGSASIGGDIHRLWLRGSGHRESGRTGSSSAELRWSRAVARWWDVVAGVRHDFRPAPSRTRAAVGVQGIAPYLFEVSAVAYVGDGGGVSAKLEAEYDMRLSNRLILQPLLEVELESKDDPRRGTGSGLSKAEAGLRLRYEVTRRFAPYVGVVHERSFGQTARFHEADGEASRDTRMVAGVRIWF